MKKLTLIILAALMVLDFAYLCRAQDTLAPLYLYIVGDGTITPFQNGQLLEVGQNYEMTAIPNPGSEFSSWQPVNIIVSTSVSDDQFGNPVTNSVTQTFPTEPYVDTSDLMFTMQAPVITDESGGGSIGKYEGWQANFIEVPEPSAVLLGTFGFSAFVLLNCRRRSESKKGRAGARPFYNR